MNTTNNSVEMYALIEKQFKTYTDSVKADIKRVARRISLNALHEVGKKSPKYTGDYSKGWSRKTIETDDGIYIKIRQTKKPTLTHLLEKGHKSRNGGNVKGREHIEPVEISANNELANHINKIIEGHKN